jgi:Tfp pilus assembly protein PilZ
MRSEKDADSLQCAHRKLRVTFDTLEAFRREYQNNLMRCGLFIPSTECVELRGVVQVELELAFRGVTLQLSAEVVSVGPPELAQAGGTPGVAVQLLQSADEIRRQFEPIVGHVPQPDPARQAGERRIAPRSVARVVGRLSSGNASLAVRTRNLSHTGVLVSVEGVSPTPVGEPICLSLVHSITGQELQVEGTVVRHVESGGRVPALAIAFTEGEAARPEVQCFVDDLSSVEHARSLTGISGTLKEFGLASLVQNFAAVLPRGTLTASDGHEDGRIAFEGGRLVGARVGAATGTKALSRMIAWEQGTFELHAHLDDLGCDGPPVPLEVALLDAARQLDETTRLLPLPIGMADRVELAAPALDGEAGELSKMEASILDLAAAGRTVGALLEVIPEEDHVVLRALCGLLDRGVLRIAGSEAAS